MFKLETLFDYDQPAWMLISIHTSSYLALKAYGQAKTTHPLITYRVIEEITSNKHD